MLNGQTAWGQASFDPSCRCGYTLPGMPAGLHSRGSRRLLPLQVPVVQSLILDALQISQ